MTTIRGSGRDLPMVYNASDVQLYQFVPDIEPSNNMKLLLITLFVAFASADVSHIVNQDKILRQELNVGVQGEYQWAYETDNGISASEQGTLKNPQSEDAAEVVQGEAKWTAPEGEVIQFSYTADENGYQPQGSHLPTSPPIPEAILRALRYIEAHPPKPESPGVKAL